MNFIQQMMKNISKENWLKGYIYLFAIDLIFSIVWMLLIVPELKHAWLGYLILFCFIFIIPTYKLIQMVLAYKRVQQLSLNKDYHINNELLKEEKKHAQVMLTHIKALYRDNCKEDAIEYITENLVEKKPKEFTDCPCTNGILQHYEDVSKLNGIEFQFNVAEFVHDKFCERKITVKILSTILGNLMDNSIDALKLSSIKNKRICLDIDVENEVIIVIRNNGPKIKDIGKIFEPRYSTKGSKRGLGLIAVLRSIDMLEGSIDVASTKEETSFEVTL